jgi:ElaA protein
MISWDLRPFARLTSAELYDVLALRQLVFVVEQQCVYQDCDGKDLEAIHVMGREPSGKLVACARLLAAGVSFAEPAIGRVVTHPSVRRTGAGRELMNVAIRGVTTTFGSGPIRIGAQKYLTRFYESLGFHVASPEYDEDGISHVEMLRPADVQGQA